MFLKKMPLSLGSRGLLSDLPCLSDQGSLSQNKETALSYKSNKSHEGVRVFFYEAFFTEKNGKELRCIHWARYK